LYARVSKWDASQNPENQLIRLRKYAQEQGYDVYDKYVDMASGADQNRPQLDRMLQDARGHRFNLILTVKIDRIARSMPNFHDLLKALEKAGVKFHFIDQPGISNDTADGKLMMNILEAFAEFERELIRDRTKAGLARVRAEGKRLGRPDTKIDFEKVRELKAQGLGIRRIAKELKIAPETLRRGLRNEGGKTTRE